LQPRIISLSVILVALAASAQAQSYPSQARGLSSATAYQGGQVGQVNLFNGGLYSELHPGFGNQNEVFYSNDGTYLRLRLSSTECASVAGTPTACRLLESPGGTVREFHNFGTIAEPDWRLTRTRDRFGNLVDVTYTGSTWECSATITPVRPIASTEDVTEGVNVVFLAKPSCSAPDAARQGRQGRSRGLPRSRLRDP